MNTMATSSHDEERILDEHGLASVTLTVNLCMAKSCSSYNRELINPSAVSLPTEFIQLDWQFGHDASNFSRRITAK